MDGGEVSGVGQDEWGNEIVHGASDPGLGNHHGEEQRHDDLSQQDVAGTNRASVSLVKETVMTAPTARGTAAAADAKFQMRVTRSQLRAWRAFAASRGETLAETLRAGLRLLAGPGCEAELGLAKVDVQALAAELRAIRGGVMTSTADAERADLESEGEGGST